MRRRRDQADAGRRLAHPRDPIVDLVARQLAAFAGLGALRHLDLQIVGVDEIFDVDAEAARGDLLDRRAHRIAVGQRLVALRVLAALAGIRLAAEPVQGDRQRRVRLPRDRAERHGAAGEALDDLRGGLDLVERDRIFRQIEIEQRAQRDDAGILLADALGVFLEAPVVVGAHRVLQQRHRLGVPDMRLAIDAEQDLAARVERVAVVGGIAIGETMAPHGLLGDLVETDAFDRRGACR